MFAPRGHRPRRVNGAETAARTGTALVSAPMSFQQAMEQVAQLFEVIGALVLVAGLVVSVGLAVRSWRRDRAGRTGLAGAPQLLRQRDPAGPRDPRGRRPRPHRGGRADVENVVILGVIVLIRTLLSFSLEIEIEGVAPWRRALTTRTRPPGCVPGSGAADRPAAA